MNALTFQDTTFNPVCRQKQVWLRDFQIGSALGYAQPAAFISRIYNKHADEFAPSMTRLVRVKTNGGYQNVRVFSLRGAHLLAMFARTPVAKEFRRWVLDVLDKEVSQEQAEVTLNESEAVVVHALMETVEYSIPYIRKAEDVLRAAESPLAEHVFDCWHEAKMYLTVSKELKKRCEVIRDRVLRSLPR